MLRDKPLHNFLFETVDPELVSNLSCYCTPWIDVCVILFLIKLHKPKNFLEIGTHKGYTTRIIADKFPQLNIMALPQNLWVKSHKNWGFPPQTPGILEA